MLVVLKWICFVGDAVPVMVSTVSQDPKLAGFTEKNGLGSEPRPEATLTVAVAGVPEPFVYSIVCVGIAFRGDGLVTVSLTLNVFVCPPVVLKVIDWEAVPFVVVIELHGLTACMVS